MKHRPMEVAIFKIFGTQIEASKALGIRPSHLSPLVRGHRLPNAREREKLRQVFSDYQLRKFFPEPKVQIEGTEAS